MDIRQLLKENDTLRELASVSSDVISLSSKVIDKLESENDGLRQLVTELWELSVEQTDRLALDFLAMRHGSDDVELSDAMMTFANRAEEISRRADYFGMELKA